MKTVSLDLSWLCLVISIGLMLLAAFFGTRARFRDAKRIMEAQARGAFADMSTQQQARKFRWVGLMALAGLFGMASSTVAFILRAKYLPTFPNEVILALLGVSMLMSIIAGTLMQREIGRRL